VKRLLLTAMTALLLSVGTTWAGPFEDGVAAHKRGDFETALKIFRPLAAKGDAKAQTKLGLMYYEGEGVAEDYSEALKWFQLAAAQGYAEAQFNLGGMYGLGEEVKQDDAEAVKWHRLAAAQGYAAAQTSLGLMLLNGHGIAQDYVHAHMWFSLAAASGDAVAVKNRDIIAREMTPQQIAQAKKLARDCQQRKFKGCD
jgi:uncharacterized protein